MSLKISAAVYNHIGHRPNNEDNFFFNGQFMEREQMNKGGQMNAVTVDGCQLYAVCDGMGGAELGEEASLKAVQMLKEYKQNCAQPDSSSYLEELIGNMSEAVDEIALSRGMESGDCGSTISMIAVKDWYFRTINVGDSRIYILRDGQLKRITKDDSEVQMMIDRKEITPEEAWQHPLKNVITKHLGMPLEKGEKLKAAISIRKDLVPGDRFLLCSDGLSDQVQDEEIEDILKNSDFASNAASTLVHKALTEAEYMGVASDNITVIVIDVLKTGEKDQNKKRIRKMKTLQAVLIGLGVLLAGGLGWSIYQLVEFLMR